MPDVIILSENVATTVKVTGEQWVMMAEAVAKAMEQVRERIQKETGKLITKAIVDENSSHIFDLGTPPDFSYRDWALIALFCGHMKTVKDIADFLVKKRFGIEENNR